MVEKTEAWKTTDGKLFIDKHMAIEHDKESEFKEWYSQNEIYEVLTVDEFVSYVKMHKSEFLSFLID